MFKKVAFTYYPVTDVARPRKFYERLGERRCNQKYSHQAERE
ncbi:MAG: hypothetical protein WA728_05010 [Xanthobacteraceae bacterium]